MLGLRKRYQKFGAHGERAARTDGAHTSSLRLPKTNTICDNEAF